MEALRAASIYFPEQIDNEITQPYYIGLAEGHIKALTKYKPPFLIFEDDARILPANLKFEFEVPDDADALYVGTNAYGRVNGSTHYGSVIASEAGPEYLRVYNMLGLHAVAYLSQRYVDHVVKTLTNYIRDVRGACDDPVADTMHQFKVLCLRRQVFFAQDGKADYCTSEPIIPSIKSMNSDQLFRSRLSIPSDITDHLCTLRLLAMGCSHITEFGVRTGNSTAAFLAGLPLTGRLHSYDINTPNFSAPEDCVSRWQFTCANTAQLSDLEPTDLLFIDTLHTYDQVKAELRHANRARKWLVFHDTELFGTSGEIGQPGINRAIDEFRLQNSHWVEFANCRHNNGLLILRRE